MFEKISAGAEQVLKKSRGSHDWEHTQRVLRLAVHLAKKEKADIKIVKYAAVLHDISRHEEDKSGGKKDHALLGAKKASRILLRNGFKAGFVESVKHCIECHRFRSQRRPATKEAMVLFDADKLDSIGAVGIGRAFLFAGEVGAKLHNPGADILKTKPYTQDDTAYREYMVKLRYVRGRMFTREGKKLAKERHAFMMLFFKRLGMEAEGKI
ncbi:MAG: phosphohydrolase [Candidatus Goldiibacteriota bacterium HGW-Goldbacteria-1]|nr:MAG: phosphohydrolase [Candidatus Goldiibacteriota bacterium HGW-Goldbacteria-1]